jgi:predicted SAM-dependent methyltransferase
MFEENTVDEIMLIHVFEHLFTWEGQRAVKRWYDLLKPGGRLTIEVPCMNKILDMFARKAQDPYLTFYGLYGEQHFEEPEMVHKWCYSEKQLVKVFMRGGFDASKIQLKDPVYHRPERDMRVEGVK